MQHQIQGQHAGETGKISDPSRIILARHGETLFNIGHRLQGWCDSPLTEAGESHASELGLRLHRSGLPIDTVAYADTGRHRHTARIVLSTFPEARSFETPALRECIRERATPGQRGIRHASFVGSACRGDRTQPVAF